MWRNKLAVLVALLVALLVPAVANASPLEEQATAVCKLLKADPTGLETLFNSAFMNKVGKDRLYSITTSTVAQTGPCKEAKVAKPGLAGEVTFVMEKGATIPAQMAVEPQPPHLIAGLLLKPPIVDAASLDEVVAKMKALRGTTSVLVQPLDGGKAIVAHNDEKPLAVGSAFKLYIAAELGRQLAAGKRKPSDVVVFREAQRSFSSAYLEKWPADAPLTLHTAATMMISKSDNSATDLLLGTVGAETVEAGLAASGHQHPEGMRPFLSTMDAFKLKLVADAATRGRYARASVAERRKILAGLKGSLADVKDDWDKPRDIDTIEWFASTGDLCRVMDVLRKQKPWRDILTVNPGLRIDTARWKFIGYKGGSEPGVINMTYLLEDAQGKAVCVSASWNDPAAPVEDTTWTGLVGALIGKLP